MRNRRWVMLFALLLPILLAAQAVSDADRKRFEEIKARHDHGEQISADDQRFAQSVMTRMNQANAAQRAGISQADQKRFEDIKARHDRGEQISAEDQRFAQGIMARMGQPGAASQQQGPVSEADRKRYEEIKARHDRGEQVSDADRQFAMGVQARLNQGNAAPQNSDYAKAHPPRESMGLIPLPDLGTGMYQGEQGGLYPGGRNTPPAAHLNAGLTLAKSVAALDPDGQPSPHGSMVFLTIGMSNTTMESQALLKLAGADQSLNPKLKLVDGAQGGQTAHITADPKANFWTVVDQRLAAAGATAKQVEVVWVKQANANPSHGFPAEARQLQADLTATLHNLHDRFPNLKIAYLSSRIYGGYAATALNPEPYAYEGGFAVKWTISAQISGNAELNFDPSKGAVRSPWIAWGPYLWSDGIKGRKQDALVYTHDDLGADGTHPSNSGQLKVARQLLDFLKQEPTSKPWLVKQ